jgi:soluble lytic murein transglycosylase-like protein
MFKKLDSFVSPTTMTILLFAIAALPFIILPFVIVSNRVDTEQTAKLSRVALIPISGANYPLSAKPEGKGDALWRAQIGYDASILRAVRKMGLVLDHFDVWMEQHPDSSLSRVRFMSASMQRNVASTALFIRKTNPKIDEKTAWREAAAFVHYSNKYGIPSALSTAVANAESTFDPDAISSKGASGVMQVMWKTHQGLLKSNGIHATSISNPLSDPEKAIAAGCLLLSRYLKAYGSLQLAMNRYSGGASASYLRKVNRNIASIMNHHAQIME